MLSQVDDLGGLLAVVCANACSIEAKRGMLGLLNWSGSKLLTLAHRKCGLLWQIQLCHCYTRMRLSSHRHERQHAEDPEVCSAGDVVPDGNGDVHPGAAIPSRAAGGTSRSTMTRAMPCTRCSSTRASPTPAASTAQVRPATLRVTDYKWTMRPCLWWFQRFKF